MKTCRECGLRKPLGEFNRGGRDKDGYQALCRICSNAYGREWWAKNRERERAKDRARYAANPELYRQRKREEHANKRRERNAKMREAYAADPDAYKARSIRWREENPERYRANLRQYYEEHRESYILRALERRARKSSVTVERVYRTKLLRLHDGLCGICGKAVDPEDFHVDHIIPLVRGGEHSYANTQPAHPVCNRRKGTKLLTEI